MEIPNEKLSLYLLSLKVVMDLVKEELPDQKEHFGLAIAHLNNLSAEMEAAITANNQKQLAL